MRYITLFLVFILTAITMFAQDDACPTLVQEAIEVTEANCAGLGRNQACYGNVQIHAVPASPDVALTFEQGGDIVDVSDIASLQLSSLVAPEEWGVALLSIQANLPDTLPGQNVTIVLFGDVIIENTGSSESPPVILDITINSAVNVRDGAGIDFAVIAGLDARDVVLADGRNDIGDWVRIQLPDDAGVGWVYVPFVTVDGDVSTLNVVATDDPVESRSYGPMQSFTFRSGIGQPACAEAPRDGILIQTPEGAGKIDLRINEVQISLGSTVYLQAIPDDSILVALLEGYSTVTVEDTDRGVPAGTQLRIPANADGLADGEPTLEPLDLDNLTGLPLDLLPREIEIAEPLELFVPLEGTYTVQGNGEMDVDCPTGEYSIGAATTTQTVTILDGGAAIQITTGNNSYQAVLVEKGIYRTDGLGIHGRINTFTVTSPDHMLMTGEACGVVLPTADFTFVGSSS